jgi:hypothetical protein
MAAGINLPSVGFILNRQIGINAIILITENYEV